MSKSFSIATVIVGLLTGTAFAGSPPTPTEKSRIELARSCALLGGKGEGWGLDSQTGSYGCRNTENGNTVYCSAEGKCRDYFGDPRWKTIKDLLKAG